MIEIIDKHKCCGCEACVQICPKSCILFEADTEGFLYPKVNGSLCIDCGLCEKVCPELNQRTHRKPLSTFATKNRNIEELQKSSSGGLFIFIAKQIIKSGGVVFGAKFDENWEVIHDSAETEDDLMAFVGSKYVQSHIGQSFQHARNFLLAKRVVLFSGTPCQILGLKTFLRRDYENLITIDFICHGVPSPLVWKRYTRELINSQLSSHINPLKNKSTNQEESDKNLIRNISFRDKRTGWKEYSFTIDIDNGHREIHTFSERFRKNSYMRLFLSNLTLRPSCYECPAKEGRSQSDITIADLWGAEDFCPELYDERGAGLMIINSNKGIQFIDRKALVMKEISLPLAISHNSAYLHSMVEPKKRQQFFYLFNSTNISIDKLTKKLLKVPLSAQIKHKLRRILKLFVK